MAVVRIAGQQDAGVVAQLLGEFRDWWGNQEPPNDAIRESVIKVMNGGDAEFLLAPHNGEPVGVCQTRFRWSVWKSAEDCWLEDLYVREAARRMGLGRALVNAAIELARARGCRRIELDVNEDNAAALALYQSCGFALEPKPPGRTLFIGRSVP
jgi:GNAT superfamily N-acetyltransferase